MTLLGGIGTLIGPVFGAGLVVTLQNYLATSDFPVTIITGLVFMVCVLLFRRGIVGEFYTSRLGRKLGFEHRPLTQPEGRNVAPLDRRSWPGPAIRRTGH